MKKILTIGNGFVSKHLNYPSMWSRLEFDENQISNILDQYKPDVLINCIGKTGRPNIDWCEDHKEETVLANTAIPILLASVCARKGIHLIQIGSGCIFFGPSPRVERGGYMQEVIFDHGWDEEDFANPQSFYSKTKYACDLAIGNMSHVSLLRIRMPISTRNDQRNLINKLKSYSRVIDIPNSVTFMSDLSLFVDHVIKNNITGIYHVTNPSPLTAAQVMMEYKKYYPEHTFEVITGEQLDKITLAKRSNCILNTDKLAKTGFNMTSTKNALAACMKEYVKNIED
jgi:UDP-glucose 4,6-dehydratase